MSEGLPPGPPAVPVLGHLPWMVPDGLGFLTRLSRQYGDMATFRMGKHACVLVNEPSLIGQLIRDRELGRSPQSRAVMRVFLGDGLLSLEGEQHRRHRRLMQPAFHHQRIRGYVTQMADDTYASLDAIGAGEVRDARGWLMELTFTVVSRVLLSADMRGQARAVGQAMAAALPSVLWRARLNRVIPWAIPHLGAARAGIAHLHSLSHELVVQRRREGGDRGDLLSMLLSARDEDGSALSNDEVAAEVLSILAAGHETTALTLAWAMHLLALQPAWQDALHAEVERVVGARPITAEDLPRLVLSERVVSETLRLYPAAWWGDRASRTPYELGGYTLPPGTTMVWTMFVTQRDPRFFADPERFDPDRFEPTRARAVPSGAYLPFGSGPHACIGNTFAQLEARLILSALAQRFRFERVGPARATPVPGVTLGMREPLRVRFTPRPRARTAAELSRSP